MLNPEKYFDDLYEYVDLWVSGYTAAYCSDLDFESCEQIKSKMIESVLYRLDVINSLRIKLGLDEFSVDDSYDYYVNNLPEFNDKDNSIDLNAYDNTTKEFAKLYGNLAGMKSNIKLYLILMGAPKMYIENRTSIEKRVDMANRMFMEAGYNPMQPREIENLLIRMLTVGNDY